MSYNLNSTTIDSNKLNKLNTNDEEINNDTININSDINNPNSLISEINNDKININSDINNPNSLISEINNSPNKDVFISLQELHKHNNLSDKSNSSKSKKNKNKKKRDKNIEKLNEIKYVTKEYSECCEMSTCCKKLLEFEVDAEALIDMMPVCAYRKQILIRRYAHDIADYERSKDCMKFSFRLFQMIVTIGSILVPSLLSIQMTEHVKTNYEIEINLGVWVISIVVSICNGIINLFKMDELYYNLGITLEKLKTIWYQYVSLSGPFTNTTHDDSFHIFINMMEEIIMTQKFQEYIDSKSDKNKPREIQESFDANMNVYNKIIDEDDHDHDDDDDDDDDDGEYDGNNKVSNNKVSNKTINQL